MQQEPFEILTFVLIIVLVLTIPAYQLRFSRRARSTRELHKINVLCEEFYIVIKIKNFSELRDLRNRVVGLETKFHTDTKNLLLDFINDCAWNATTGIKNKKTKVG